MEPASEKRADILRILQYCFFIAVLLYFGQALFIPLSFAFLISFILYPFCRWLESKKIPRILAIFIGLLIFTLIVSLIFVLFVHQFSLFLQKWPALYEKILIDVNKVSLHIEEVFGLQLEERREWINTFFTNISQTAIQILPKTVYSTGILMVLILLVPFYSAAILYYRDVLVSFLYSVTPSKWNGYIKRILPDVIHTYYNFIIGMAIVYLIVGVLNSAGLAILGIPNAIFFGFVASILTFIPYVGITIGALLPMTVSFLLYDSIWYPVGVVLIFAVVQILEANLIFPLAVSYKLKINAFITILAIIAGGILWGASGMILFLPFLAILKLISERVHDLHPIAILLGTRSEVADQDH